MRIAIVCYPTMGGSGVVATELARHLACRGHTVHLVASDPPIRLTGCLPNLTFHQVVPPEYPLFRYRPYESALAGRLVRVAEEGIDIIHVHYAIPHAVSAYLARQTLLYQNKSIAVVTTLHGTDTTLVSQDPDLYPIVRLALRSSNEVTAVSYALAEETQERFYLDEPPIVIPNFVDTTYFSPEKREANLRAAFASPEEILLVHASNFRPIKQTTQILYLLDRLLRKGLAVRLLMIGDGPDRAQCEHLAHELQVWRHVHFVGGIQDVAPLLAIGDVFVLTSAYESFGLAALEAMASGVPVVAASVGGLPEIISSDSGALYPPNNLTAASEAVLRVVNNLAAYRMGALRVAHLYDAKRIIPLYERLYARHLKVAT
ncbi:MAG: N-acetyl-alpha-D-glucosaminyl L-malate synthase BshA [Bacteroidia bacterium]|nr:N-acetyl-alpha-D-glucosaminyl L-malate synthase BshA [Bacteroidia bacterium]